MVRSMIAVFSALMAALASAQAQDLKGDADAVDAVRLMIDRLGGEEVWSNARSMHLVYEGWRTEPPEPVVEEAWRDLAEPYQHAVFEGRSFETKFSMTPDASWLSLTGRHRPFTDEEHGENLAFWDFDFYTIIRNLAAGDERITLRTGAGGRVLIEGPGGADWGWFEIDAAGQPVRWGAVYGGDEPLEYLYGPVKSFGNVNFPAWGTASDGSWRFDYLTIDVSRDPIPFEITPPRS